ncbi:hypothetical protein HYQ46_006801 [Verticillium longisporum]|nr:hypothetical protein HYQ46_006801 [Verticillium longisporum]
MRRGPVIVIRPLILFLDIPLLLLRATRRAPAAATALVHIVQLVGIGITSFLVVPQVAALLVTTGVASSGCRAGGACGVGGSAFRWA